MEAVSLKPDKGAPPPTHVALIMDGNGRWAKARGLPRVAGHREGAKTVRRTIEAAISGGVRYLTLFGFSSENWKRPEAEVNELMGLLRYYLRSEVRELHDNGVRIRFIGDRQRLSADIVSLIEETEALTHANERLDLIIALSYGGRAEIVEATRSLAGKIEAGVLKAADIDETMFGDALFTGGIPDPDLLIRTSGEHRISNFLLWQCAYTEFLFIDTLWPDFSAQDFNRAIEVYHGRERRYGATSV